MRHLALWCALLSVCVIGCEKKAKAPQTQPAESGSTTQSMENTKATAETSASAEAAPAVDEAAAIDLFNGKDLSGWTFVLADPQAKMEDVWSVSDGVLRCKGKPAGYLRTKRDDFHDYLLTLDWRWPDPAHPGNNGVLVHASTPGVLGIWPKSIEVQLLNQNAGDFWIIGTELDVENEAARREGRRHKNLTDDSEKPLGEWNHFEILCKGNEITVKVNGTLVNHATNCSVTEGAICLQSEGAPIEYRNIRLTPLK